MESETAIAMPEAGEHKQQPLAGCRVCGGKLVKIRGKYPGEAEREVCPTCLQERIEMIQEMARPDYGVSYSANAEAHGRQSRTVQPLVGRSESEDLK